MPRREDHEVHKDMWGALDKKEINFNILSPSHFKKHFHKLQTVHTLRLEGRTLSKFFRTMYAEMGGGEANVGSIWYYITITAAMFKTD